ncbi:MAG: hypothetical protein IME94_03240 [Proteobacteria bacterium]|nr:hypothetical protein [Pseudomonadota bacterium]
MPEQSLDIECSHCHNTAHYKVGHDGDDKLEASLEYLKGKTKIHIKSLIAKHKIPYSYFLSDKSFTSKS